ncbi:hypothetical protein VPH35_136776 [Triticum aestivum]
MPHAHRKQTKSICPLISFYSTGNPSQKYAAATENLQQDHCSTFSSFPSSSPGPLRSLPAPPSRRRPPPPPQSSPPPPSRSVLLRGRPLARLLDSRELLPREIRHRRLGAAAPSSGGDPPLEPPPSRRPAYNGALGVSQLGWRCGTCFIIVLAYICPWTKGRLRLII